MADVVGGAAGAAAAARDAAFDKRVSDVFGYFKEIKSTVLRSSGNSAAAGGGGGEYTSGFRGAIYSLGLSEPSPKDWHAWSAIVDTIDSNGVGTLTFDDFRFIVEQQREKVPTNSSLLGAFSAFEEVCICCHAEVPQKIQCEQHATSSCVCG